GSRSVGRLSNSRCWSPTASLALRLRFQVRLDRADVGGGYVDALGVQLGRQVLRRCTRVLRQCIFDCLALVHATVSSCPLLCHRPISSTRSFACKRLQTYHIFRMEVLRGPNKTVIIDTFGTKFAHPPI